MNIEVPKEPIEILGYDLQIVLGFLAGIIITAFFGFLFSILRERRMLKLNVQLETADELQKLISTFFQNKNDIHFFSRFRFNSYNSFLSLTSDKKIIDQSVLSIKDSFLQWEEAVSLFNKYFFAVTWQIELRQIVLVKFEHFQSKLLDTLKKLSSKTLEISKLNSEISVTIGLSKIINENSIEKHEKLFKELDDMVMDISMYMLDLQTGLQNEFYKKLFRNGVPPRKPSDSSIEVLLPKKSKRK